jgi:hypothetical protein
MEGPDTVTAPVTLLPQGDSSGQPAASAVVQPGSSHDPAGSAIVPPQSSEDGDVLWIGYRKEDFSLAHGIEPEEVAIPAPPQNAASLTGFLKGTIWGWGESPSSDGGWVLFLDDNTLYGSWGYRYRYHVDPDTMEVVWSEHRTGFSDDFRYLRTEGRNPRVGMLLKRADQVELDEFLVEAEGMDVIEETQSSMPWRD